MARKPPQKRIRAACFDIDGTLIRDNFSLRFVEALVEIEAFDPRHCMKLAMDIARWRSRLGHYDKVTAELMRTIERGLKGVRLDDIIKAGEITATNGTAQPYVFTRALFESLQSLKHRPVLTAISGSPFAVVEPYCRSLGFNEIYATLFKVDDDGRVLGGYKKASSPYHVKDQVCFDIAKRHKLEIEFEMINETIAIGDALADHRMMKVVEYPIAFNPTAELLAECRKHGTPVVTERKDAITIMVADGGKVDSRLYEVKIEDILPAVVARRMRRKLKGLY